MQETRIHNAAVVVSLWGGLEVGLGSWMPLATRQQQHFDRLFLPKCYTDPHAPALSYT